eukprot:scaffold83156_cov31-Phaeocystis_antarctica.AAC.2
MAWRPSSSPPPRRLQSMQERLQPQAYVLQVELDVRLDPEGAHRRPEHARFRQAHVHSRGGWNPFSAATPCTPTAAGCSTRTSPRMMNARAGSTAAVLVDRERGPPDRLVPSRPHAGRHQGPDAARGLREPGGFRPLLRCALQPLRRTFKEA